MLTATAEDFEIEYIEAHLTKARISGYPRPQRLPQNSLNEGPLAVSVLTGEVGAAQQVLQSIGYTGRAWESNHIMWFSSGMMYSTPIAPGCTVLIIEPGNAQ